MLGGDTAAAPDDAAAAREEALGETSASTSGAFHFFVLVFFLGVRPGRIRASWDCVAGADALGSGPELIKGFLGKVVADLAGAPVASDHAVL